MCAVDEPRKRGRGRPPGSKNKKRGQPHRPISNEDLMALQPSEDSPLWRLPYKQHAGTMSPEVRVKKMNIFLDEFATRGIQSDACAAAGIHPKTILKWRELYPPFAEMFETARQVAAGTLEREAWKRAVDGWDEPVYQGGELVGTVLKKSDRILELMLRARVEGYNPKTEIEAHVKPNKLDALPADSVDSLLRIIAAAEERGLFNKPEMVEGEFVDASS